MLRRAHAGVGPCWGGPRSGACAEVAVLRQSRYRLALGLALVVLIGAVAFVGNRLRNTFQVVDAMGSCDEANQLQTLSPDRRYIATVFVRGCGGTTGYVTHVNLRKTTDALVPDRSGVITAGEVVTTDGVASVTTRWVGNAKLEVGLRGTGPLKINTVGMWNDVVIRSVDEGVQPSTPR